MSLVDRERLARERAVHEDRNDTAIRAVVLVRPIAADRPDPHGLGPEHLGMVETLQLAGPLRDGVIVHLLDGEAIHDVLTHQAVVIPVHLGRREEDHLEPVLLLQPQHVLGADDVRAPEVLVVILSVPPSVLGGQVVDVVEAVGVEDRVHLLVRANVRLELTNTGRMS